MDDFEKKHDKNDYTVQYGTIAAGNGVHKFPLWYYKTRNAIFYILGFIEVLLAFRFVFKLLGANPASGFVRFIYTLSGILTAPFSGIFSSYTSQGLVYRSIFEPSVIVALIVYAIAAWGIVKLIKIKVLREEHF
jgi:hypothetical protein